MVCMDHSNIMCTGYFDLREPVDERCNDDRIHYVDEDYCYDRKYKPCGRSGDVLFDDCGHFATAFGVCPRPTPQCPAARICYELTNRYQNAYHHEVIDIFRAELNAFIMQDDDICSFEPWMLEKI